MGLRAVIALTFLIGAVACVQPTINHCPDVDCPAKEVCDNQGGCALPDQLAQCVGKADGAACSYTDIHNKSIVGACAKSVCLPIGCGNGLVTPNEVCDDGNTINGDGCSADCQSNEICGNGVVDPARGEQCDDGNLIAGDGCQPDCKNPRCGDSVVDTTLNEACDDGAANSMDPDAMCRPNCQLPHCGDGIVDPAKGEVCDDGNQNPGDGCSSDCKSNETCGNGTVDVFVGEVCDDGNTSSNDGCSANCHSTEGCGNGVIDSARGEICDDGNIVSGDGCSSDCRSLEVCGNAIVDTINEECDLGGMNSNVPDAMCRPTCKFPACGDNVKDPLHNEQCDTGPMNSNTADKCRTNCQLPRCGDMIQDSTEACDDGNNVSGDNCSGDCRSNETCGNSYVDSARGEQCDAGASNSNLANAACRTNCQLPRCGDGAVDTTRGEACDAGGLNSNNPNAMCRTNCQPQRCGDMVIDNLLGEVCDDGNSTAGDGCSPDCKSNEMCGNGIVDVSKGEQCDAGMANSNLANAPCRTNCQLPSCGDGAVDTTRGEACDLGGSNSNNPNATCRTNCQPQRCGDLIIDNTKGEVCDDGNTTANDGCSPDCKSNEMCGNGIVDISKGEQCDAGMANSNLANAPCRTNCQLPSCGDGAVDTTRGEACDLGGSNSNSPNATCRTNCQPQRCGDNILDNTKGEVCDDNNVVSGDGCSADCKSNETCPNGYVDTVKGEQCDDNNMVNNDFCHNNCTLPRCGDGIVDFNEQCDAGMMNANTPNAPCRTNCLLPRCGDTVIDTALGEVCDDGNLVAGDGCRPDCKSNESCGNGIVDVTVGELCDDGNGRARDGCSACKNEDLIMLQPGQNVQYKTYATMAFDAARQRMVLFYGQGSRETWEWDGVSWTQMRPRTVPPARYGQAMSYDSLRHRVVMFGGYYNSYKQDTWEWDGNDWVDKTPAGSTNSPDPRNYQAMVFDPKRGKTILYGGSGTTTTNDTWEWNGTAWAKLTTTGSPGQKVGHRMVWDGARQVIMLYGGGADGTRTWTFDSATMTWTDKGLAPAGYPLDYYNYMAYDPTRQVVVLWRNNGVTYEWNGTSWATINAATPITDGGLPFAYAYYGDMAFDAARRQLVAVTGYGYDTAVPTANFSWMTGTYLRTGTVWSKAPAMPTPGTHSRTAGAYDPTRGKFVLFGGGTQYGSHFSPFPNTVNDTWEWDGRTWAQIAATTPPAPRGNQWMDYNSSTKVPMMFGGNNYDGTTTTLYVDLYQYNTATTSWTVATSSGGRTGLYNSAMAYDANANKVVTFGGADIGRTNKQDTWTWDSVAGWVMLNPTNKPPARRSHAMAYDPVRKRTVMFGGYGNAGLTGDVWEWNGVDWSSFAASGPAPRKGHELVYNPDARVMNVIGNNQAGGLEDMWEWNGTTFTQRPFDNPYSQNYHPALAYDAARHGFIEYGGKNYSTQTMLLRYRPYVSVEACMFSGIDYDNDGLAGCADPDCWSVCTPLCPPGAASCPASPKCGDGVCGPLENCDICPGDCTTGCPSTLCGDYRCQPGETHANCPNDC